MKVINDWMVSCDMKKDIKVLKDPITKKPIHPVTFADGIYLNNGTRLEDNLRYLFRKVSVIGDLEELGTTYKSTLVGALNEVLTNKSLYSEYGVRFVDSQTEGERLGDAVDMCAHAYYGSGARPNNDFDRAYPWSDIKRCLIDDNGTIWAYEGEPGFTLSPTSGNIFVEIPKFYQKLVSTKYKDEEGYEHSILEMWVSPHCKDDKYELNPAFIDDDGNELPFIYIGAYEATYKHGVKNEEILSRSGQNIIGRKTLSELNTLVSYKSKGFKLININERNIIELLFCIEYATRNSQSIFKGKNVDLDNIVLKTGETDFSSEYPSCSLSHDPDNTFSYSFRYRYMENLWGNAGEIIDGIIIENNTIKLSNSSEITYPDNISGFFISERNLQGIPVISVDSDNNRHFCDYVALPKNNEKQKVYIVGYPHVLEIPNDHERSSLANGLFSVCMNFNIDEPASHVTSRLVYRRQK